VLIRIAPVSRRPVWSDRLTIPLAARVPAGRRSLVLDAIKAAHSAIFFSIAGLIVLIAWDGLRARPRRRTAAAAVVAFAEAAVYASNNQVCPLTPLAEELGAASGTVTDMYLPGWLSRRIPVLSGSLLVVGMILNGRAFAMARSARIRS